MALTGNMVAGSMTALNSNCYITAGPIGYDYLQLVPPASGLSGITLKNATGFVGLNNTNPAYILDVFGTSRVAGSLVSGLGPRIIINNTGGNTGSAGALDFYTFPITSTFDPGARIMGIDTGNYGAHLTVSTHPSGNGTLGPVIERMRITDSGNVGIGTTTPQYILDVNGSSRLGNLLASTNSGNLCLIHQAQAANVSTNFAVYQSSNCDTVINTASGYPLEFKVGNVEYLRLASNGNIGIGTASPQYTLDVNGTVQYGNNDNQSMGHMQMGFFKKYGYNAAIACASDLCIPFGKTSVPLSSGGVLSYPGSATFTEYMRLTNAGYLGIGTSSPQYLLDVNGSARIVGSLSIGTLSISTITIGSIFATLSTFSTLSSSSLSSTFGSIATFYTSTLSVSTLSIGSIFATLSTFSTLTASSLSSTFGSIATFYTSTLSVSTLSLGSISSTLSNISTLTAGSLFSSFLSCTSLSTAYSYSTGTNVSSLYKFINTNAFIQAGPGGAQYDYLQLTSAVGNGLILKNNTGFVGINTVAPQAQLDVSGSVNISGSLSAATISFASFYGTLGSISTFTSASLTSAFGSIATLYASTFSYGVGAGGAFPNTTSFYAATITTGSFAGTFSSVSSLAYAGTLQALSASISGSIVSQGIVVPKIMSGSTTNLNGTGGTFTVSFPSSFSNVPIVTVTPYNNSTYHVVSLLTINTSNFTFYSVYGPNGGSIATYDGAMSCNWIAVSPTG